RSTIATRSEAPALSLPRTARSSSSELSSACGYGGGAGRDARSPLQPCDEARRIPASTAHLLHFRVELIDQRADRQSGAVLARFAQANGEILAHPVDCETKIELARRHGLVAVLHLPGLRRALGDGLDHRLDVNPRLFGQINAFRH